MSDEDPIASILGEWQARRDDGEDVSPESVIEVHPRPRPVHLQSRRHPCVRNHHGRRRNRPALGCPDGRDRPGLRRAQCSESLRARLSPDGARVVFARNEGAVRLDDVETGDFRHRERSCALAARRRTPGSRRVSLNVGSPFARSRSSWRPVAMTPQSVEQGAAPHPTFSARCRRSGDLQRR